MTESNVPLSIAGLRSVMAARMKKEQAETYTTELLYLLVKMNYSNVPTPVDYITKIWKPKKTDKRTAKSIIDGLTEKLSGSANGGG